MKEQKSQHNQLGSANKQEAEDGREYQEIPTAAAAWGRRCQLKVHCHEKLSSALSRTAFPGKKASDKGTSSTHLEAPSLGI